MGIDSFKKMKIALILNPFCRGGKGKRALPPVRSALESKNIGFDLFTTENQGHATEIAGNLQPEKYDRIAVIGGDGTNFEVLNGLLSHHRDKRLPPLALLPAGSGNSFARDLNLLTLEDGIDALLGDRSIHSDVCSFSRGSEEVYFINTLGCGFVCDVAATARNFKWLGRLSYVIGVFHRAIDLRFYELEIKIDDEIIRGESCFVEFCNSRYTGGNMLMAPGARIDDGLLDIVLVERLDRLSLLGSFPKIFRGRHGEHPAVRFYQGRSVSLKCSPEKNLLPDGELLGRTPIEIRVLPGRVEYCIRKR